MIEACEQVKLAPAIARSKTTPPAARRSIAGLVSRLKPYTPSRSARKVHRDQQDVGPAEPDPALARTNADNRANLHQRRFEIDDRVFKGLPARDKIQRLTEGTFESARAAHSPMTARAPAARSAIAASVNVLVVVTTSSTNQICSGMGVHGATEMHREHCGAARVDRGPSGWGYLACGKARRGRESRIPGPGIGRVRSGVEASQQRGYDQSRLRPGHAAPGLAALPGRPAASGTGIQSARYTRRWQHCPDDRCRASPRSPFFG